MSAEADDRGSVSWMARNSVAANLLMVTLIVGGFLMASRIKQEVFPEFDLDVVTVTVPYPGASPAEVEQGIVLAIEDEVRGLDGVKRVGALAQEGFGTVYVELLLGTDANKALQDVKNAVDRIDTFPENAERPTVSLLVSRLQAISLVIYGDQTERTLRSIAEKVRDELIVDPGITLVELSGIRPLEISIEVSQDTLREYGLTLEDIASEVRQGAVELPGGGVKTSSGEVLLRTAERRDYGEEFAELPVVSLPDGTRLRVGDIASIIDGFEDTDEAAFYNGKPAVMVDVYRVGDQTPIEVADTVRTYMADLQSRLPEGVDVAVWQDWSEIYTERMVLLLRNACLGLALVLILLGMFLEVRLAFWVTMGIPTSFLGALLIVPALGASINMITLFAFIMALGIVVDDAIVVGENVYEMRQRGMPFLTAAVRGARQVAVPVVFAVLTNVAAFMPLVFVPGFSGKIYRTIPAIIVPVFLLSLVEALYILPAHLTHEPRAVGRFLVWVTQPLRVFSRAQEWVVANLYRPVQRAALRFRYVTVAVGVGVLILTVGYIAGGRINFIFMPRVEADQVIASAVLPYGTPLESTMRVKDRLLAEADAVLAENGGDDITEGVFVQVGRPLQGGPFDFGGSIPGSHLVNVQVSLVPEDQRDMTAGQFANQWREGVGEIPGAESLSYTFVMGPSAGAAIDIVLSHPNNDVLAAAAQELAARLAEFRGLKDVDDGYARGKPQLDFKVRPEARSLGITAADLGRKVRNAFYGAEALRQQRGRDEIKVMVRLPESERRSEYHLEELLIRTREGGEIPLTDAAEITRGRAYTSIGRRDGSRIRDVTADIEEDQTSADKVLKPLVEEVLPALMAKYPGLTYSFSGEIEERQQSLASLGRGFAVILIVIFAMLAIPLRSYLQPIIIMTSIPFGIVGAAVGHIIMGYDLSVMSMMGIVALAGVVVNDSLVLIHATNERLGEGASPFEAISGAGVRRFRPIMLTSLTTFFGLAPMIFETSIQARFLIPMAISLGYGILFATLITLLLVPSLYLVIDDAKRAWAWAGAFLFGTGPAAAAIPPEDETGPDGDISA
jgi:multidrug efflux pump subunit AcrB